MPLGQRKPDLQQTTCTYTCTQCDILLVLHHFLLVFSHDMWPNSTVFMILRNRIPQNLSDIDLDLSRSLKIKSKYPDGLPI